MILVDSNQPMVAGDVFQMLWSDWGKILRPPVGPYAISHSNKKIDCKVAKQERYGSIEQIAGAIALGLGTLTLGLL